MSALRMCAYGVLILPRVRNEIGYPIRELPSGIISERAKIIGMVTDELNTDYPGWRILPYSIAFGIFGGRRSASTFPSNGNILWNTDTFSVVPPLIPTSFGPAQIPIGRHRMSWQEACLSILRIIEPDNNAWV